MAFCKQLARASLNSKLNSEDSLSGQRETVDEAFLEPVCRVGNWDAEKSLHLQEHRWLDKLT